MSYEIGSKSLLLLLLTFPSVAALGCTSNGCAKRSAHKVIELQRIAEGEAPVANTLAIYSDGTVALQHLGGRQWCGRISQSRVLMIADSIRRLNIESFEGAPVAPEAASLILSTGNRQIIVSLETPLDSTARSLLELIDQVFLSEFGEKHDLSLVTPGILK